MSVNKVELVKKFDCSLGEGPHWDDVTQTLLFIDHNRSQVLRWDPTTKDLKCTNVEESTVGCVVPRRGGGLVVAAGHHFSFLDEESGTLERIKKVITEFSDSKLNDGKCDPAGRLWAGSMGAMLSIGNFKLKRGALYCMETDLEIKEKIVPVDLSNGMSWTSDKRTMFYCDTLKFSIDAYDYDVTTGNISNMRPVVTFDEINDGFPDGLTTDVDGNIWVAMFSTGQVIKIDATTGQKVNRIKVSETALRTTSVCFGGPNFDEMYVTSARNDTLMQGEDFSGSMFKITNLGTKGLPANVFEG